MEELGIAATAETFRILIGTVSLEDFETAKLLELETARGDF